MVWPADQRRVPIGGKSNVEIFVSETHRLIGKPYYVLNLNDQFIPSSANPGELLERAAYCLLIEEHYNLPVHQGRLQYSNRSIDIPFDQQLGNDLLATIQDLRAADAQADVPRNHTSPARYRGCGFRATCKDSLASKLKT